MWNAPFFPRLLELCNEWPFLSSRNRLTERMSWRRGNWWSWPSSTALTAIHRPNLAKAPTCSAYVSHRRILSTLRLSPFWTVCPGRDSRRLYLSCCFVSVIRNFSDLFHWFLFCSSKKVFVWFQIDRPAPWSEVLNKFCHFFFEHWCSV